MIWKIVEKEFLLNLMTFKFSLGTLLCLVLAAVFVLVPADDYHQRLAAQTNKLLGIKQE